MLQRYGMRLSRVMVRNLMKQNGFRWRRLVPIATYVNSEKNIKARSNFAMHLITQLEKGKKLINIDESGFKATSSLNYGWVKQGESRLRMHKQRFKCITLISAITSDGDHFYTFVQGTIN